MSSAALARLREARGFAPDARFTAPSARRADQPAPPAEAPPDPVAEAYRRGHAEGAAAARDHAERRERERDAARAAIELAFARFDEAAAAALRERLRETVLSLCEHAVLPLAVDPQGLAARIERAAAMLRRAQDERRVLLHPDDLALVRGRLPDGLAVDADPGVERGALRIETPDGGIEDGPSQWRRILAEAFREC